MEKLADHLDDSASYPMLDGGPAAPGPNGNGAAPAVPRTTLQRSQSRNIWRHFGRDVTRASVLLVTDVAVYLLVHRLVNGVRAGWLGDAVGGVAVTAFPPGFLGGFRFILALLVALAITGSYGPGDARRDASRVSIGAALAVFVSLYASLWQGALFLTLFRGLAATVTLAVALSVSRALVDWLVWQMRPKVGVARAIVVAHSDADWRDLAKLLGRVRDFVMVSHVSLDEHRGEGLHPRLRTLGAEIAACRAETVVLWGDLDHGEFEFAVDVALATGCHLLAAARTSIGEVAPHAVWVGGRQMVELTPPALRGWRVAVKRLIDLAGASLGLLLSAPVCLAIAVAILFEDGRPILFRQKRIGRGGRPFHILKFRSMVVNAEDRLEELRGSSIYADDRLFKMVDDPRVTRVGRFLRRTSLDELPQLLNVLAGQMSLVGPRPPLPSEVEAYEEHHYARFDVKPGITGPWQTGGRNAITDFEEVIRMESEYIRRWSFVEDLRILARTIPAVLRGSGAH
jgi:exopolysaccharide biosynthesis polyprenyl glycosylphosphotransferase